MPTSTLTEGAALKYRVEASNTQGDTKVIARFTNKSDALDYATLSAAKYVNIDVTREGRREKTVYSHTHFVPDEATHKFTHSGVALVA